MIMIKTDLIWEKLTKLIKTLTPGTPPLFLFSPWCCRTDSYIHFFGYFYFFLCYPFLGTVLPFHKYIFSEVPPTSLLGSAVACGGAAVEPGGGSWEWQPLSVPFPRLSLAFLHRALPPHTSPAAKTCPPTASTLVFLFC